MQSDAVQSYGRAKAGTRLKLKDLRTSHTKAVSTDLDCGHNKLVKTMDCACDPALFNASGSEDSLCSERVRYNEGDRNRNWHCDVDSARDRDRDLDIDSDREHTQTLKTRHLRGCGRRHF